MNDMAVNQRVAERICRTEQWDGRRLQQGQCVALLDGNVVAVADDLDTVLANLRAVDSDPDRGMVFEVGPPVPDVIRGGWRGHDLLP